jgi:HCOMODA/2-hydroxy-3-carboxy-muconic semialdehyde decarboxylase
MTQIRSGIEIRKERERRRLSRERLAGMVGVSTATLRRWEVGEVEPSALVLRGIERAFLSLRVVSRAPNAATKRLETLVLANKILVTEGLVGPFGHVSVRSSGGKTFFIARHEPADLVQLEDLVEIEIDVTPEAARERNLYLEVFIHSSMYQHSAEIQAVVHTHSPYAVALGTMAAPQDRILPTTNPGANLGSFIPIFQEVGLVKTPEMGSRIARALHGQNGVLLRGHGAIVVGRTLEQAVLRAIYLEFEAHAQIVSRNAGKPRYFTPREARTFRNTRAIEHAWRYYSEKAQTERS